LRPQPGLLQRGAVQLPLSVRIEQGAQRLEFRFRTPRLKAPDDADWHPPDVAR
jgi:hypothetical protein